MEQVKILNRRDFLAYMGHLGLAASSLPLVSCSTLSTKDKPLPSVQPTLTDEFFLAEGISYQIVLSEGEKFNKEGAFFGSNADYVALIPINGNRKDALLWVNHEFPSMTHMYGTDLNKRNDAAINKELDWVGGSIVRVKNQKGWKPVMDDKYNRRIDGRTMIRFSGGHKIEGKNYAMGTLANCAGGVTPWNTILTCEENFHSFYGFHPNDKSYKSKSSDLGWEKLYKNPSQHYGWVVEINPFTGDAKKLVSLGRFAHESATVTTTKDGRAVAYSGDDAVNECLYKFVASKSGTLEEGTLYVADFQNGRWLSLDRNSSPKLRKEFKTQLDVQVYTRNAAELIGGSPLDRPEDIEIDPKTGAVIVALTNNKKAGRPFGSFLHLKEKGDYDSLEFESKTLVSGGQKAGFACPDNLVFDPKGNLWFTTDISSSAIGKDPYKQFGNNGLFVIPMSGPEAGTAVQVGSAPVDAELTGLYIAPDNSSLFVCVQHPGSESYKTGKYTSHWPDGGSSAPRSAVVSLTGKTIDRIFGKG